MLPLTTVQFLDIWNRSMQNFVCETPTLYQPLEWFSKVYLRIEKNSIPTKGVRPIIIIWIQFYLVLECSHTPSLESRNQARIGWGLRSSIHKVLVELDWISSQVGFSLDNPSKSPKDFWKGLVSGTSSPTFLSFQVGWNQSRFWAKPMSQIGDS